MKKSVSVWMLLARSTFWKICAVLAVTGLGEAALLALQASKGSPLIGRPDAGIQALALNVENLYRYGHISLMCGVGAMAVLLILMLPGWHRTTKTEYTLRRLQVSPKGFYLCHAGYSFCCLLLYWAVQALTLSALTVYWGKALHPELYGPETLLLAAWRVPLLHALLPLADWSVLLRGLAMALLLAVLVADSSRRSWYNLLGMVVILAMFPAKVGDLVFNLLELPWFAVATVIVVFNMKKEAEYEL